MPSMVAESPLRTQVVPILIPRTCEYGRFPGAGELTVQMEFRLLI